MPSERYESGNYTSGEVRMRNCGPSESPTGGRPAGLPACSSSYFAGCHLNRRTGLEYVSLGSHTEGHLLLSSANSLEPNVTVNGKIVGPRLHPPMRRE